MWAVEFICKPDLSRPFSGCENNSSYECH